MKLFFNLIKSPLNQYEIPYTSPLSLRSISQVTFGYLPHLGPLATFNAGCGRSRLSGALQLQCPVRPTGHVAAKRRRGSSAGARWESLGGCKKWEDMMVKWIWFIIHGHIHIYIFIDTHTYLYICGHIYIYVDMYIYIIYILFVFLGLYMGLYTD
jgi:hypothetical protein